MATEYKLSYTAKQIDEKLSKIDELVAADIAILEEAKAYSNSKGGYIEVVDAVLCENEQRKFELYQEEGISINLMGIPADCSRISVGTQLHVNFDGISYNCTIITADGYTGTGNLSIMGMGDNTGEPFLISISENSLTVIANDAAETHIVGITYSYETIHPINVEYIPEAIMEKIVNLDDYSACDISLGKNISIIAERCASDDNSSGYESLYSSSDEMAVFWNDVDTDRPLKLKLPCQDESFYEISSPIIYRDGDGAIKNVSFTYLLRIENPPYTADKLLNVFVSIDKRSEDGLDVTIRVIK